MIHPTSPTCLAYNHFSLAALDVVDHPGSARLGLDRGEPPLGQVQTGRDPRRQHHARNNAERFGYVPMLDELAERTRRVATTEPHATGEYAHASKCINY